MSQTSAITLSTGRPPALATVGRESPDLLFVLRHYRWIIILGFLLGAGIGYGLYKYMLTYYPGYAARCGFHVRSRGSNPIRLHSRSLYTAGGGKELQFAAKLYRTPTVLSAAIALPAFQRDYRFPKNKTLKSQWLTAHETDPVHSLQKILSVSPEPASSTFDVQLTTGDPRQSRQMLQAINDVYLQTLQNQRLSHETRDVEKMSAAIASQESKIRVRQRELEDYRVRHDVPGIIEQKTIIAATLGQLNAMLVLAEIRATQARQQYLNIKKQVNNNTLRLTANMQEFIDQDPGLRDLRQVKMALKQQFAVDNATLGPDNRATRNIQVRIAEVDRQIHKLRDKLRTRARLIMQQNAKLAMVGAQTDAQEKRRKRDEQQRRVEDLDRFVAHFDRAQQRLHHREKMLEAMKARFTLLKMKRNASTPRVKLYQPPRVSSKPTSPKLVDYMAGGPILGLLAMFGLGYLLELTNTRVRTPRDITRTMQLPLLGWVPDQQDDGVVNGDLMTSVRTSPASMIAESFRQIRGRLAAQTNGKPLNAILVASLSPGGGATTVASNLANSIALNDLRVLLVDVNFYRPGLHQIYPNIPTVGLSDVIAKDATLDEAIVPSTDLPMLHLLGAGTITRVPGEMPETRAFRELLTELRSRYDLVIFDGAPLSIVSDSLNLAAKVDGVIAVARAGAITRGTVGRIRDQLRQVNATLLGIVLNAAQTHGSGYFKKNYRSFYDYASGSPLANRPTQKAVH